MIFKQLALKGAYEIEIELRSDDRGFFARTWCKEEFEKLGLNVTTVQCNIAYNNYKNTIRGMHYQVAPYSEVKLIRCTRGAIYDVIIDLRTDSETYMKWYGVELSESNKKMLYIPEGFAHGYLTLEDNSEIFYQVSQFYNPASERGVRWNDTAFNINWLKTNEIIISDKDKNWPDYK